MQLYVGPATVVKVLVHGDFGDGERARMSQLFSRCRPVILFSEVKLRFSGFFDPVNIVIHTEK